MAKRRAVVVVVIVLLVRRFYGFCACFCGIGSIPFIGARQYAQRQHENGHEKSKKSHRLRRYVQHFIGGAAKIVTLLQGGK